MNGHRTYVTIQELIKSILQQHNITQAQFARDIGDMSPVMIAHWLKGRTLPTNATLQRIATTYAVPYHQLREARDYSRVLRSSPSISKQLREATETSAPAHDKRQDDPHPANVVHLANHELPTDLSIFSVASPVPVPFLGHATVFCRRVARFSKGDPAVIVLRPGEIRLDNYDPSLHKHMQAYLVTAIVPCSNLRVASSGSIPILAKASAIIFAALLSIAASADVTMPFNQNAAPSSFHAIPFGSNCPPALMSHQPLWSKGNRQCRDFAPPAPWCQIGAVTATAASVYTTSSNLTGFALAGNERTLRDAYRMCAERFGAPAGPPRPRTITWTNHQVHATFQVIDRERWCLEVTAISTNQPSTITQF